MDEQNPQYYEGKDLENLVECTDWGKLLPILYSSTRNMMFKRFLADADRGIFGKTFKDFVHEALTAFLEGHRKCPKHIKVEYFLWQTIRNMVYKHLGKHYSTVSVNSTEEDILKAHYTSFDTTYDQVKIKSYVLKKLESDEVCKSIFECWAEGMDKPADIRELYGYSASDYNSGRKRLMTVLKDIRTHLKNER
jgi:hypothetical protein